MLTRNQKEKIVSEIVEAFGRDKSALFIDYRGVKTAGMRDLRLKLRDVGGTLRVVRKTLFLRALEALGIPRPPDESLEGQFAVVYGFRDAAEAAKALREFKKGLEAVGGGEVAFSLRGGMLGSIPISLQEAEMLSRLPSRQELLAKFAASFAAPLRGFVVVLSGPYRGFVQTLKGKVDQSRNL